jgi:hypothetical protein
MLKPGAVFRQTGFKDGGVVAGNMRATAILLGLLCLTVVLVAAIVVWPLLQAGRPDMPAPVFAAALAYFAIIGLGFMLIQIPLLQQFSLFLGHPTYTFSIVLFLMILAAGLGSLVSDRVKLDRGAPLALPLGLGIGILIEGVSDPGGDRGDDGLATAGTHAGGGGVHRAAGVRAWFVFSDRHAARRPPLRSRYRVDVGRERRLRRDRINPGGHGLDVARHHVQPDLRRCAVRAAGRADAASLRERQELRGFARCTSAASASTDSSPCGRPTI